MRKSTRRRSRRWNRLEKRLPKIADYAAFFLASAKFESGDYAGVPKALDPVFKMTPVSPLAARAVLLMARAYGQAGDTKAAIDILRKNYSTLPQPAGDLAMALAFAAAGDSISAVVYHQRVYYGFPMSAEAAQSGCGADETSRGTGRQVSARDAECDAGARGEADGREAVREGARGAGSAGAAIGRRGKRSGAGPHFGRRLQREGHGAGA